MYAIRGSCRDSSDSPERLHTEEKRFLSAYENLARQPGYEKNYKVTFGLEYSGDNEDLERYEIIVDNLEIDITQKLS